MLGDAVLNLTAVHVTSTTPFLIHFPSTMFHRCEVISLRYLWNLLRTSTSTTVLTVPLPHLGCGGVVLILQKLRVD